MDDFSLANHRRFTKFTKLSPRQTFPLYGILDLILTSQPGLFTDTIVPKMSDHGAVTFQFNATVKRLTKVKYKILLFHKANLEEMKAKLQRCEKAFTESNPSGRTVEENWTLFKQYIFVTINEFVPTKYVRRNNDLPWINRELKCKLKKRKDSIIMLDLLKILETGKHIRKSKTKLLLTSNKLMVLTVITCLMLHILVIANGFGPILRIFGMTFQT